MFVVFTILIYFLLLFVLSQITGRKSGNTAFFSGEHRSPWYVVAIGMVGASISGITFVSVPGMVMAYDMTYLQACMGFVVGYLVVAFVLLPLYYRNNLISIYGWLKGRLGNRSYKTASAFFLLSKMCGASLRFYVVCLILHRFVLDEIGVPFSVSVVGMVLLIWLYTRRGGVKTLVWTDCFQTICMLGALILVIWQTVDALGLTILEAAETVANHPNSRVFMLDDWISTQNFWKQFVSGIFIVIVMTGLDQDMMQKNLTCKTLRDAQKDMCSYGCAFVPVNLLFLSLGVLLVMLTVQQGKVLPADGDSLLPMFAASGDLGPAVVVMFTIGIIAASFSSADSAITSMTTVCCVDIFEKIDNEDVRHKAHIGVCALFAVFILLFEAVHSASVIDAVYILCSYTYGPLLGMFAFGIITNRKVNDKCVPYIACAAPLVCLFADKTTMLLFDYNFGYELLMLNGLLVFVAMLLCSSRVGHEKRQPT